MCDGHSGNTFITADLSLCSKKDPELLNKMLPCLQILLQDDSVNVQKKVILSLPQVYKVIVKISNSVPPTILQVIIYFLFNLNYKFYSYVISVINLSPTYSLILIANFFLPYLYNEWCWEFISTISNRCNRPLTVMSKYKYLHMEISIVRKFFFYSWLHLLVWLFTSSLLANQNVSF